MAKTKKNGATVTQAMKAVENLNHLINQGYPVQDSQGRTVEVFEVSENLMEIIPIYKEAC